jgi:hypothetical protein
MSDQLSDSTMKCTSIYQFNNDSAVFVFVQIKLQQPYQIQENRIRGFGGETSGKETTCKTHA